MTTHSSILAQRMTERLSTQQPFPATRDLPDPGIELGLLHCWWILYHLSYYTSIKKGKKQMKKQNETTQKQRFLKTVLLCFRAQHVPFPVRAVPGRV